MSSVVSVNEQMAFVRAELERLAERHPRLRLLLMTKDLSPVAMQSLYARYKVRQPRSKSVRAWSGNMPKN